MNAAGGHREAGQQLPLRCQLLRVGTLNVRTSSTLQLAELAGEMHTAGVHITGLQECRRPGFGSVCLGDSGATLVWSGAAHGERRQHGVGAILAPRAAKSLLAATSSPVAPDRLLLLHLHASPRPLAVIVAYAPTNEASTEDKDHFWAALSAMLATVPSSHSAIVLGDLNAVVGRALVAGVVGPHAVPDAPPPPGAANAARAAPTDHRTGVPPRADATDNGLRLVRLCAEAGLVVADSFFARDAEHTATWRSPNGRTWAALDHVLVSRLLRPALLSATASWQATAHHTDHALLTVDIYTAIRRPPATAPRGGARGLDWERLADTDTGHREAYELGLGERVTAVAAEPVPEAPTPEWTEAAAALVTDIPMQAAVAHLPKRAGARQADAVWLGGVGRQASARQRKAWRLWDGVRRLYWRAWEELCIVSTLDLLADLAEDAYERYRHCQRLARRVHFTERQTHREAVLEGIAHANRCAPSSQRHAHAQLRRLCDIRQPQPAAVVRAADGSVVSGQAAVDTIAAAFAAQEVARPLPDVHRAARVPAAVAALPDELRPSPPPPDSGTPSEPTVADVAKVLGHLRQGAPGRDGLSPLALKAGGASAAKLLHRAVTAVWRSRHTPARWRESVIAPLPKPGDYLNPGNRRRIALLNTCAKAYASLLAGRMQPTVDACLLDEQHGFRKHRGTSDAKYCVARVTELAVEHGRPVYAGLIDFKQAFDAVDRQTMWAILRAYGAEPHVVDLFADLYADSMSSVRVGNHESAPFPVHAGVRQGCPASPMLFNVFQDLVLRCFKHRCRQRGVTGFHFEYRLPGGETATRRLLHAAYADDLILLCESLAALQTALEILYQVAQEWGMVINFAKCEVVIVNPTRDAPAPSSIEVQGTGASITVVPAARYLGWLLTADRSASPLLARRLAAAGMAYRRIASALRLPGPRRTRATLYKVYVLPVLLAGIPDTCAFSDAELAPLATAHNDYLRRLTGMWRRPDGRSYPLHDLSAATGVPSLQACIDSQRLTRLGHVARMPDSSVVKQLLFATGLVGCGRPPGRPRRTWLHAALDSLGRASVEGSAPRSPEEWVALARNRARWRNLCMQLNAVPATTP